MGVQDGLDLSGIMGHMRAPRALKHYKGAKPMLGFYGCNNRLVTVAAPPETTAMSLARVSFRVQCPACGVRHLVRPAPYQRVSEGERRRRAEVFIRRNQAAITKPRKVPPGLLDSLE